MSKKPTIALIPSGYKTDTPNGKLYSILPNDGTQDFRIDRATSGTRYNKDGLIVEELADTPRLDYTNSDCPSVLRESQSINLLTYSEQLDNSAWTKTDTTVTANSGISPNGEYTADKLTFTSTSTSARAEQIVSSLTSGSKYTTSFYIKSLGDDVSLRIGTSGSVSGEFTDITATSEWKRFEWTSTASGTTEYPRVQNISGISGTEILVWGCQFERYVGATSYIKTEGTIQTRNLDNINCENETYETGDDVTWYLDFNSHSFVASFRPLIVIRNSGFTQTMDWISYNSGSDYYFRIRVTNQSALQTIIAFGEDAIQMFTRNKVAIRLYGSNFEVYVNGTREYTGTSADGDWTLLNNSAVLNDFGSNTEAPSMRLYDFRVYNQTMTQSELETLTTL